ncbi:hypothetical protein Taro_050572, partial [Colocasia esculenta]|nr:hypothetical protein [Colocasia esculenta]
MVLQRSCSASPMAPPVEKPVFAHTSLGTCLAVAVPPDITVGDLKGKLGKEHSTCFPSLGEIKIHALMVKKKLQHYHLPNPMLVRHAFNDFTTTWFLFINISLVGGMGRQPAPKPHITEDSKRKEYLDEGQTFKLAPDALPDLAKKKVMDLYIDYLAEFIGEGCCRTSQGTHIDHNVVKCQGDKSRCNKGQPRARLLSIERAERRITESGSLVDADDQTLEGAKVRNYFPSKATPCGSLSGNISITGIISKYFSDLDEVDSHDVNSPEYEKTNTIDKFGENCMKVSRLASSGVASFDIGGSSLDKFDNRLEGMKNAKIAKCTMVLPRPWSSLDGRSENAFANVLVDDCRACRNNSTKLLKDEAVNCTNIVGHVTQSMTNCIQENLPLSSDFHVKTSRKLSRNDVGKRLLAASTKLALASGKKRSPISTFVAKRGKPSITNSSSAVKNTMFDVNDWNSCE